MPYSGQTKHLALVKAVGTYLAANNLPITTPEGKAIEDVQKLLTSVIEGWTRHKRTERIATVRSCLIRSENPEMRELSAEDLIGFLERSLAA